MLKNNYFAQLKALFFKKGISIRQSNHLIEELQDHLALKTAEFQAQGNNSADSELLALESMGTPKNIAEKAAADLQSGWLTRYAWLLCSVGFFLAPLAIMIAIMVLGYYFAGGFEYDNGNTSTLSLPILQAEVILFNWLPMLIGMSALALLIRFSSIGWKSIFIIAIFLGAAVSLTEIHIEIIPIFNSPKLCFFRFDGNFIIQRLLRSGKPGSPFFPTILVFKLFVPFGMCLFARYIQPYLNQQKQL